MGFAALIDIQMHVGWIQVIGPPHIPRHISACSQSRIALSPSEIVGRNQISKQPPVISRRLHKLAPGNRRILLLSP